MGRNVNVPGVLLRGSAGATYERQHEAAIIVSQDSDFGPAVRLAKELAKAQDTRLVLK